MVAPGSDEYRLARVCTVEGVNSGLLRFEKIEAQILPQIEGEESDDQ
jgi:hypothetical protein